MSKVVKKIGRAIKKVFKGVTKFVKKVFKSKIFKVIAMAAAVYFGGAALMGAMGTSGAAAAGGLSGLSGATANISAAWSSLGTAGSALMGGNLSAAGSAVASGFTGTAAAGGSALAGAAGTAAGAASMPAFNPVTGAYVNPVAGGSTVVNGAAAGSASAGMGELTKYALVNGAMQLGGNLLAAKGQEQADEEAMARYNQNVGTRLFADGGEQSGTGAPPAGQPAGMAPRPQYGNTTLLQQRGLVASQIQPPLSGQYPTYNPYYYG